MMIRQLHSGHYSVCLLTIYHYGYSFGSTAPQNRCLREFRFLSPASLLALFFDDYARSTWLDMIFTYFTPNRGKTSS